MLNLDSQFGDGHPRVLPIPALRGGLPGSSQVRSSFSEACVYSAASPPHTRDHQVRA